MNRIRTFALATAAALAACAGAPTPESRVWIGTLEQLHLQPETEVESIPHFRIDGFKVLDSMHVVLYTGARLAHVVTLRDPCAGLETAVRLGYTTSAGSLTRFDKLFPVDRDRSEQPCLVARIQSLKPASPER
jgi:Family of unknown function (DUF6491)